MHILGEFFGYLAGLSTAICFLPQTIKTIKTRDVGDLSFWSYMIYNIGMLSWIIYGVYLHSVQMMIFNSVGLVFAAIILCMIVRYKKKEK
ncbi:MAG: glutathione synthetase [Alphaproteobacteria bacterium]|nr:glutathione synthetase [Alphaproteobacteria bacterium]